jgi:hypothetical protein
MYLNIGIAKQYKQLHITTLTEPVEVHPSSISADLTGGFL